jgi:carbonic anhydrase
VKNIKSLIQGSKKFKKSEFKKRKREFEKLAKEGQNPKILFIGCCDSRVLPNLITNTGPGDLFVVRNIGNFVAPYKLDEDFHSTAAAIEYAVNMLEVEDIIVCGHSNCGAISALYYDDSKFEKKEIPHVKTWLNLGRDAKEFVCKWGGELSTEDKLTMTEEVSVLFQLENLLTYPSVKERVDEGKLSLHGWHYDIESGDIYAYDEEAEEFMPLGS